MDDATRHRQVRNLELLVSEGKSLTADFAEVGPDVFLNVLKQLLLSLMEKPDRLTSVLIRAQRRNGISELMQNASNQDALTLIALSILPIANSAGIVAVDVMASNERLTQERDKARADYQSLIEEVATLRAKTDTTSLKDILNG